MYATQEVLAKTGVQDSVEQQYASLGIQLTDVPASDRRMKMVILTDKMCFFVFCFLFWVVFGLIWFYKKQNTTAIPSEEGCLKWCIVANHAAYVISAYVFL